MTESLARVGRNPEHVQLLSEHRRLEKGRKELESQVISDTIPKIAACASNNLHCLTTQDWEKTK